MDGELREVIFMKKMMIVAVIVAVNFISPLFAQAFYDATKFVEGANIGGTIYVVVGQWLIEAKFEENTEEEQRTIYRVVDYGEGKERWIYTGGLWFKSNAPVYLTIQLAEDAQDWVELVKDMNRSHYCLPVDGYYTELSNQSVKIVLRFKHNAPVGLHEIKYKIMLFPTVVF